MPHKHVWRVAMSGNEYRVTDFLVAHGVGILQLNVGRETLRKAQGDKLIACAWAMSTSGNLAIGTTCVCGCSPLPGAAPDGESAGLA